jgi:hypothetical protein
VYEPSREVAANLVARDVLLKGAARRLQCAVRQSRADDSTATRASDEAKPLGSVSSAMPASPCKLRTDLSLARRVASNTPDAHRAATCTSPME